MTVSANTTNTSETVKKLSANQTILDDIKPINFDEIIQKIETAGYKYYSLAKENSIFYFLGALAVSLTLMFIGIFIKTLRTVAIFALFVGIIGFLVIQFAPDLVYSFVDRISNGEIIKQ